MAQPNLLVIMDDQHRHDYLGCYGAPFLNTPNIDEIAGHGMRFERCFTSAPVCAPARMGLATGLHPFRLPLQGDGYLPRSIPTHYQQIRDHGYRVGCVGKLDLAKRDKYNGSKGDRPCVFGWGFTHPEECEGKMHAGSSYTPIGPYTNYLWNEGLLESFHADYQNRKASGWLENAIHDSVLPLHAYEDCYIGRRAAEWIESIPCDFPWYLFVSFVGPHDPFDPPTEFADKYRSARMTDPVPANLLNRPFRYRGRQLSQPPQLVEQARRQYCASIDLIDQQIGMIISALKKKDQFDDTYIVFTSDHGEMLGDHGMFQKGVPYEAALRVPLIIAGPDIPQGETSTALVENIDLNPTLCDLAGIPPIADIDALSLRPVLSAQTQHHRSNILSVTGGFSCLRTEQHKLVVNINDCYELYDLQSDPDEQDNIQQKNSDLVVEMGAMLTERTSEGKWLR